MGGYGSGRYYRWDNKTTLDDCRNIDVNKMVELGIIKEGCLKSGILLWTYIETGKEDSKLDYECNTLSKSDSYLRLSYKVTGIEQVINYKIPLDRTYPRYGGVRFWFLCPETGKRIGKLYLIPSDGRFVSRHVYNVHYASQMQGVLDRAINKKWKILDKIDSHHYPMRPKGMHKKTFERIAEKFFAQEDLCDRMFPSGF